MEMHADLSSDLQSRDSYKLEPKLSLHESNCFPTRAVEYDDEPMVDMFDVVVLNCIKHI